MLPTPDDYWFGLRLALFLVIFRPALNSFTASVSLKNAGPRGPIFLILPLTTMNPEAPAETPAEMNVATSVTPGNGFFGINCPL